MNSALADKLRELIIDIRFNLNEKDITSITDSDSLPMEIRERMNRYNGETVNDVRWRLEEELFTLRDFIKRIDGIEYLDSTLRYSKVHMDDPMYKLHVIDLLQRHLYNIEGSYSLVPVSHTGILAPIKNYLQTKQRHKYLDNLRDKITKLRKEL